ncbi:uncharacterized protein [Antedon mediterranea]|uniref:uncharacterized protein n=1 Tax=Antedon mediterranea TaxID=105859 RepID=UPI003AF9764B
MARPSPVRGTPIKMAARMDKAPPVAAAVSLKLPPFWPNDPLIWFAQVEAQFVTRGITAEETKYSFIIASLPPNIAQEVRDLLLSPPYQRPYTHLKSELVKRTSVSEQKRLHQLLTTEELGDRKPSQLLRKMYQLLGDRDLETSILKQLFVQRLPTNVQLILASTREDMDLSDLAALADKILEVSPPPPTIATTIKDTGARATSDELRELRAEVSKLTSLVSSLAKQVRGRSRSKQRESRKRSPSATSNDGLCWYHHRYGNKAHKCNSPCSFSSQKAGNDQASD